MIVAAERISGSAWHCILQLTSILRSEKQLRLPALRIHCADTLTLHNPDDTALIGAMETVTVDDHSGVQTAAEIAEPVDKGIVRAERTGPYRCGYCPLEWSA
jgi:hypothetical protein